MNHYVHPAETIRHKLIFNQESIKESWTNARWTCSTANKKNSITAREAVEGVCEMSKSRRVCEQRKYFYECWLNIIMKLVFFFSLHCFCFFPQEILSIWFGLFAQMTHLYMLCFSQIKYIRLLISGQHFCLFFYLLTRLYGFFSMLFLIIISS